MKVIENIDFAKGFNELFPKLLGEAMRIVLLVTLLSFIFAIIFGFILALGRLAKNKVINTIVVVFQEIIRGTPLLVQLVYIYYVVPLLIQVLAYFLGNPDYKCNMAAITAGVIGMTINYGTYISEVIRSAILAIDQGQKEAALALGFSPRQAMFRIVIPQAIKNSVPVIGNYLLTLVKDTSLMAYISVPEFLQTTKSYASQTFLTIESYTILAIVYLMICFVLSMCIRIVERRLNRHRR